MPSRHIWASVALVFAAVGWAIGLFIAPEPWEAPTARVIATGLLVTMAVAVSGMMIESSRLAYRLAVAGLGLMLAIALLRPIDVAWIAAVLFTGAAGMLMADRRLGGWIRLERPIAPVPGPATGLSLMLLLGPPLTALSMTDQPAGAIVWLALAAWAVLFFFVRRLPGAVTAIRLGVPILIGGGALLDLPGTAVWAALMITASVLAWSKPVRLAVRPLIERGSRVSIPPELLPDDVRRAAGIDRDPR